MARRRVHSGASPPMHASPTRYRAALLIALVGIALTAYVWTVNQRLHAGTGYTSFCHLGSVVDCDAVIGSRYSRLLGAPDEILGLIAFSVGAVLTLPGAFGAAGGGLVDVALLGLAAGSLGFALVLLGIATLVLGKACLLCLALDAVALAWFVTLLPLVRHFEPPRLPLARAAIAGGLIGALAIGTWAAARGPTAAMSMAEVEASDPKFVEVYRKLPVRSPSEVAGGEQHVKGSPTAPITIVEFSDFECPACGAAFKELKQLLQRHPDVRMVFRHFPLDASCNPAVRGHSPHQDACLAAIAAECAGQQNRFWEYHDQLFEHQKALERESLFRYARDVGLDIPTFRTCLDDPAIRDRVRADVEAGIQFEIVSTPTLFINGRKLDGALEAPYWDYALIIERHERGG